MESTSAAPKAYDDGDLEKRASTSSDTKNSRDGSIRENATAPSNKEDNANAAPVPNPRHLSGKKLVIVHSAILLSVLLIALDQSIVATAIPRIVSEFDALAEVSWVASAYFLTQAGFILFYGGLLAMFPTKWVFMAAISIFEIGSLICAVSKSMDVLIFGRAFSGVGAAGMFGSVIAIIAEIAPIERRPALFGSFGAVFALSSVLGPLLGGIFTDHVSWRWCFYINLPVGAISIAVIGFFLKAERSAITSPDAAKYTILQRWIRLDWAGTLICIGMVTSLLLPLQWGGNTRPWNDPVVIALFCVFGVVVGLFVALEWKLGSRAILPLHMFKRRTQIGCCLSSFFVMLMLLVGIYELPLFYQAKGHSATKSGIDILPFMLAVVVAAGVSGGVIGATGRYWWFLFLSPLLGTVGAGLLFSIDANTANAKLIVYQILYGLGIGGTLQNSFIAIQAEYNSEEHLIPQSSSIVTFTQLIGGIVGIAIAGSIFANQLVTQLAKLAPDLPAATVQAVRASVTVIFTLPEAQQGVVIAAYSNALAYVFLLGVPCGVFASACALLIKDYNIKKMGVNPGAAAV